MSNADSTLFENRRKIIFSAAYIVQWRLLGWFVQWQEGISHAAWANLLQQTFWGCHGSCLQACGSNKKKQPKNKQQLIDEQTGGITQALQNQDTPDDHQKSKDLKPELAAMLKQFLERKQIAKHIETHIPDYRNQELITYSKKSIMISALAIFLFRMASGNEYDTKSHDKD